MVWTILWCRALLFPGTGRDRDEAGASLVEYTLLLAFIVLVALVGMHFLGATTNNSINNSGNSIFPTTTG